MLASSPGGVQPGHGRRERSVDAERQVGDLLQPVVDFRREGRLECLAAVVQHQFVEGHDEDRVGRHQQLGTALGVGVTRHLVELDQVIHRHLLGNGAVGGQGNGSDSRYGGKHEDHDGRDAASHRFAP